MFIWVIVALSAQSSLAIFPWPLSSTGQFYTENCSSLEIFFFRPFSVNRRDGCVEISHVSSSFWNAQSSCLAQASMPCLKPLKSPFLLILMLSLNFREGSCLHFEMHLKYKWNTCINEYLTKWLASAFPLRLHQKGKASFLCTLYCMSFNESLK